LPKKPPFLAPQPPPISLIYTTAQAYQRQLLLEKIMDENEKTARLLEQRRAIQEQRKQANMDASMHRNKVRALCVAVGAGSWGAQPGDDNCKQCAPAGICLTSSHVLSWCC